MLATVSNTTLFSFVTICTLVAFFFVKTLVDPLLTSGRRKAAIGIVSSIALWLTVQCILAFRGFYAENFDLPPRFLMVIIPPLAAIFITLVVLWKRHYLHALSLKSMTYIHVFRFPLELVVFTGFLTAKVIPEVMTFHGRNFDILVGITAPIVAYLYFTKTIVSRNGLLIWNIAGLLFLVNISFLAVTSLPYPFQQFGHDQPNVAVLNFPFVLLPALLVSVGYFCHLVSIYRLITDKKVATAS